MYSTYIMLLSYYLFYPISSIKYYRITILNTEHLFSIQNTSYQWHVGSFTPIDSIHWIIKKAREFQKNIYFCFIDYTKTFDDVDHNKLWKILKELGIPDHLTCLLGNLYAGQEQHLELDIEQQTGSK